MKLLKYELLKIGHNRLTVALFLIFLAVNLPLFLYTARLAPAARRSIPEL